LEKPLPSPKSGPAICVIFQSALINDERWARNCTPASAVPPAFITDPFRASGLYQLLESEPANFPSMTKPPILYSNFGTTV
jgi:hypothetical protein